MWMFLKVMVAMSAAAGIAAVPTLFHTHHGQTPAAGQVAVQGTTQTNASTNQATGGSETGGSLSADNDTDSTITVQAGGNSYTVSGHGSGHGTLQGGAATQPSAPVKHPTTSSSVTWGKIQSVGSGQIAIKGSDGATHTFSMSTSTKVVFTGGLLQALTDDTMESASSLRTSDTVMVVARSGAATLIVDHVSSPGPYSPQGGGASAQAGAQMSSSATTTTDR